MLVTRFTREHAQVQGTGARTFNTFWRLECLALSAGTRTAASSPRGGRGGEAGGAAHVAVVGEGGGSVSQLGLGDGGGARGEGDAGGVLALLRRSCNAACEGKAALGKVDCPADEIKCRLEHGALTRYQPSL